MLRHATRAAPRSSLSSIVSSVTSSSSSSSTPRSTACRLLALRLQSTAAPRANSQVLPNLTGRRPQINGKPVAFHVRDLIIDQQRQSNNDNKAITTTCARHNNNTSPKRQYESDLVVILDMDECLIHSQFLSAGTAKVYAHQLQRRNGGYSWDNSASRQQQRKTATVESFRFSLPDGEEVHVNVRPGLLDFLDAVTSKYETHIFTAAMEVYAKGVLDRFDPTGERFAGRWYRESCTFDPELGAHVKALDRLPVADRLNRVVLVDNNPLSFVANPSNGILVKSFYNDPTDSSLSAVWQLIEELDGAEDVRPLLDRRFGLADGLRKHQQDSLAVA